MQFLYDDFFQFCRAYNWRAKLNDLETICIPEKWSFNDTNPSKLNQQNPILNNYIIFTFKRLVHVCNKNPQESRRWLYEDNNLACFNTGLFTPRYQRIYAVLYRETRLDDDKLWTFDSFVPEDDPRIFSCPRLPEKVGFFEQLEDLLYDTRLDLRINTTHILDDPKNIERLPAELNNAPNLKILFDGAIIQVKRKIEENYMTAVCQYFDGRIQQLLPLCLRNANEVDTVLAVSREGGIYVGRTCLTVDMAYNNARLIARPQATWLTRPYHEEEPIA